ncbi:MAG TPA: DUF6311 domain-containing protein [Bryobacteraceae bacterium]|nr:DUF6311 domain-containing protein [Bryobacteraceae bacterium]
MGKRGGAGSVRFDLALALVAGLLYALIVLGPRPLNPRNVGWIPFDPAYHYIGWELFRQDPKPHWPITYTERLGYPVGESVALTDLNPLLAVALKPLSPLLPGPMQYFGLEAVLVCALQFFFAFRIFRILVGENLLGIAMASVFFLLSPPLTYRFALHYSLSNHWLLLAALFTFLREQLVPATRMKTFVITAAALAAISVGINPYLAFQVVLVLAAAVVSLLWQRKLTFPGAVGILTLLLAVCVGIAWAMGLLISGGRGYSSGGYRDLSMNLLAPIDPRGWTSLLIHRFSSASPGQYEGYNYLGAGVLALGLIVAIALLVQRRTLQAPDWRWVLPLTGCCAVLTVMALSTRITLGSRTLFDLDPSQRFSPYLAPLRATGRLFWLPYYVILTLVLAASLLLFRRRWANLMLAALLIVQVADTNSLRHWVHVTVNGEHPSPLRSPIWLNIGAMHENLIVLPAWQCAANASPGGPEGYRIFGFLAVSQKMRINSYQSARYTQVARDFHCNQSIADLSRRPLAPDSVYVVSPEVAAAIAKGPTGPGKCHDVDGFILCSSRTDFGLSPVLMTGDQRQEHAIANPGFEDGDSVPWTPVWELQAGVTREAAHSGSYSLAERGGAGTVYQDVNGLRPGATYQISAWVSGSLGTTASAQLAVFNPSDNTSISSPVVNCRPDWQSVSVSATAGREGAIRIQLIRRPGSGEIYWDDLRLTR